MKKSILICLLALAILAAGCAKNDPNAPQTSASTTAGTTASADTETTAPETSAPENTEAEPTATQQTEPEQTEPADDGFNDYLTALKEQSDSLKAALQQEDLTQAELNQKSQELYQLWDDALNDLWGKLRDSLPEDEFDKLLDEQLDWIEDKETAAKEAGKSYEGGSVYPLIVNSEAARITEDRVYELYKLLK